MSISFNNLRSMTDTGLSTNCYRVIGGVFTSISVASGQLFPSSGAAVGDYVIWKQQHQCFKPAGMRFHVGTAWTAVGLTGVWEYRLADSSWAAFAGVTDATNSFTTAGTNLDVTWTVPSDWGTNSTAVNSQTGQVWWRFRITALTSYTVAPVLGATTPAVTQIYDYAVRVDASHSYTSGTATAGGTNTLTDSGKAWTTNELKWRHVYIHTGTGSGQVRVVRSNTATAITVYYPWDTNPSTDSQYVVTANFEDLYDADVAGGWNVITKAGEHCYSFNSFLDIQAGAFGDCNALVEFQNDFMWYVSQAHTATYQMHFGWRLPSPYGLDKGIWGNTIVVNRNSSVDERNSGFFCAGTGSSYAFSAGNRYILRHDYPYTSTDGFLRHWFPFYGQYSINDYFEGWRSVIFPRTGTLSEVRNLTVCFGHSGIETARANFNGVKSYYNGSLALFVTGAVNYTFPDFQLGSNNYETTSSIYGPLIQFFSYTGTTTRYVNLKPRARLFNDVFSTTSTGYSYPAATIRALITDEYNNPIPTATLRVSDSLASNGYKFLRFDITDDYVSVPATVNNQFSGCTAFSVEAWVYTATTGENAGGRVLDKGTGPGVGYVLYNNSGSWTFGATTGGVFRTSNTVTVSNNVWHHLVGVYDGSTVKLYVNNATGTASSATGATSNDSSEVLYIGNRSAGDRTLDGGVRRVRLFRNKALSAQDVSTLWNSGNYVYNQTSPVSGCTAEYNFTEGTGTTLADTSGNANDGTLGATTAAPTWRDISTGVSANSITATTGASAEFLSNQTVTNTSSYSLSSQPTSATKLRFTVSNFNDLSSGTSVNARIFISGTDSGSNAISEVIWLEGSGNGIYFTENEYLTVSSSGITVTGFNGVISVDRAGMIYPQQVDLERWVAFDDVANTPIDFNPFYIKVSAPGYDPVIIKKEIREAQNFHIPLKRSILTIE